MFICWQRSYLRLMWTQAEIMNFLLHQSWWRTNLNIRGTFGIQHLTQIVWRGAGILVFSSCTCRVSLDSSHSPQGHKRGRAWCKCWSCTPSGHDHPARGSLRLLPWHEPVHSTNTHTHTHNHTFSEDKTHKYTQHNVGYCAPGCASVLRKSTYEGLLSEDKGLSENNENTEQAFDWADAEDSK